MATKLELKGKFSSNDRVAIADTLPTPDESWYRKFLILQGADSDELYICMRVKGVYEWVGFNSASNLDETTSELGKAIYADSRRSAYDAGATN